MCHRFTLTSESHRRVPLKGEFEFQRKASVSFHIVPLLSGGGEAEKSVSYLPASFGRHGVCVHVDAAIPVSVLGERESCLLL